MSGALAAMKTYNVDPSHPAYTNVYNPPAPTSAQIRISTSPYGNGGTDSIEALRTQPTFGPTA